MPRSNKYRPLSKKPVRNLKEEMKQGKLEMSWPVGKSASYKKKTAQPRYLNAAKRKLQKGF